MDKQEIKTGDDSVSIQALNDVTVNNNFNFIVSSKEEMRDWANTLAEQNSYKLSAQRTFLDRIQKWAFSFFEKLEKEDPYLKKTFEEPDIQYNLIDAQKAIGRSPDENLGDMLSNLLIERLKAQNDDFYRMLLNESLRIVPLLTSRHVKILSFFFYLLLFHRSGLASQSYFKKYFTDFFENFNLESLPNHAEIDYLEYIGCGKITANMHTLPLEKIFYDMYFAFMIGELNKDTIISQIGMEEYSKIQFLFNEKENLNLELKYTFPQQYHEIINSLNANQNTINYLRNLGLEGRSNTQTKRILTEIDNRFLNLSFLWSNKNLSHIMLNNIGCVIGAFNVQNILKEEIDIKQILEIDTAFRPI